MARTSSVRGGLESLPTGGARTGLRGLLSSRLLLSERALRRLIFLLICLFFTITVAGTMSHVVYGKTTALTKAQHDLGLLADAITAHDGEAASVTANYQALSATEQAALIAFLHSL